MAEYSLPGTRIFQVVTPPVNVGEIASRACIIGPFADLYRFSDADEKPLSFLGAYDAVNRTCYDWPQKAVGGRIDESYVKVFAEQALLRYYSRSSAASPAPQTVTGYRNRIQAGVNLVANGADYPRVAALNDRDAQVGDGIKVRVTHESTEYVVDSYIQQILPTILPATISAASADANNEDAIADPDDPVVTQVDGVENCVTLSADSSDWQGIKRGQASDTYTVTVIQSSVGGDFTTAAVRIISASGKDDVASIAPDEDGVLKVMTPLGLQLAWSLDLSSPCEESAGEESPSDLLVGQEWTVAVEMAFTPGVFSKHVSSTYTADQDVRYIITIVEGGIVGDGDYSVKFVVSTDRGIDSSGPTTVAAAGTAYPIGTKGVKGAFTAAGYAVGDRFFIDVEGATPSEYQTIVMAHNVPAIVPAETACNIELYIRDTVEIPEDREITPDVQNWVAGQIDICLEDGIQLTHPSWTLAGEPQLLDLAAGRLYVEYRVWNPVNIGTLGTVTTQSDVNLLPGPLHPDNPLKFALHLGVLNGGGVELRYLAISDPDDDDSWLTEGINPASDRDDIYGVVPLTTRRTVLDAFHAEVLSQSGAEEGRWRVLWACLPSFETAVIVDATTTSDLDVALAIIEEDPANDGEFTYLTVPGDNVDFIAEGVRPKDVVRYNYTTDLFGLPVYEEYLISEVVSSTTLRLEDGPTEESVVPLKMEVWRNTTGAEEADEIITQGLVPYGASKRVRAVWPDRIGASGYTVPGYMACSALAAQRGGALPHQGLTGGTLLGFDNVDRTTRRFGKTDLNRMARAGVWILTKDPLGSVVYTRHAVTAADYDSIPEREESMVSNLDNISYQFKGMFDDLIGRANIVPQVEDIIRSRFLTLASKLTNRVVNLLSGPQVLEARLISLQVSQLQADRYELQVRFALPAPFNNIDIFILV
jgi:hypothetical protein